MHYMLSSAFGEIEERKLHIEAIEERGKWRYVLNWGPGPRPSELHVFLSDEEATELLHSLTLELAAVELQRRKTEDPPAEPENA